jgi:hypothetical protein
MFPDQLGAITRKLLPMSRHRQQQLTVGRTIHLRRQLAALDRVRFILGRLFHASQILVSRVDARPATRM